MSDYKKENARWTMILIRRQVDGKESFERSTFDLVRFNVDDNPTSEQYIMPVTNDSGKIFERIWKVDEQPYKVQFFGVSNEHNSI